MIRKAIVTDVPEIKRLIEPFVKKGLMLPKSLHSLYTSIRDFWVMYDDERQSIIGCCALQISWEDMGEIRTLAVLESHQGRGYGLVLVETCILEAKDLGLKSLFTLTYAPDFFRKTGFIEVEKANLPNKIWADCIHCPHFPECDETALLLKIGE
jgi:amino-acid N-acetyltransferase